ncbi:hypothetical protein I79_009228 [Cricetulus griseus]|uniref:Uncharacterized protein n=1 Tax=Cricetulus griseus TaxID=10029 RepID=G3HF73_CRIGR|nr:hypothetical protein I79_009228 [Cricetulus griseus]
MVAGRSRPGDPGDRRPMDSSEVRIVTRDCMQTTPTSSLQMTHERSPSAGQ